MKWRDWYDSLAKPSWTPKPATNGLIVWATIIRMMVAVWKHHQWVAVAQVPY